MYWHFFKWSGFTIVSSAGLPDGRYFSLANVSAKRGLLPAEPSSGKDTLPRLLLFRALDRIFAKLSDLTIRERSELRRTVSANFLAIL